MKKFNPPEYCPPVNAHATKEAQDLLKYLYECAGHQLITGQHTQTNPMEEREYIHALTGKYPKLLGFELLSYSPNINWEDASEECLTEVRENQKTMETALQWALKEDGIVTICFHWFSPLGGRDKAFYTENTDFDAEKVLEDGSPEQKAFDRDMEVIANELRVFQKNHIPVLWRPFHEVEGTWFWWGANGGRVAAQLYKRMYHYFTDICQLNHLLWVWSSPTKESYPGDEYVDVVGWDIYLPEKEATDYAGQYQELLENTTTKKVFAITELGYNPDIKKLSQSQVPWSYYMTWSKEFILGEKYNTVEELRTLYEDDYTVKLP